MYKRILKIIRNQNFKGQLNHVELYKGESNFIKKPIYIYKKESRFTKW